jgi:hypothetical protein
VQHAWSKNKDFGYMESIGEAMRSLSTWEIIVEVITGAPSMPCGSVE